jgi:hypothetical protein
MRSCIVGYTVIHDACCTRISVKAAGMLRRYTHPCSHILLQALLTLARCYLRGALPLKHSVYTTMDVHIRLFTVTYTLVT